MSGQYSPTITSTNTQCDDGIFINLNNVKMKKRNEILMISKHRKLLFTFSSIYDGKI